MAVYDISKISFGILSAEEIRNMAVCKVFNSKTNNLQNSVYDPKMGNLDTLQPCVTCGFKKECWGHFGYIDLVEPIVHPMFYKQVRLFLKYFCKKCYRFVLTKEQIEFYGLDKIQGGKRFEKIKNKLIKVETCSHCNSIQPNIISTKDGSYFIEYKSKQKDSKRKDKKETIPLSVEEIKKIFDNISIEDVEMIGLDSKLIQPKNLIITVFPVIPSCSRPYVMVDGNSCDDDLTYQIVEIIKVNKALSELKENQETERNNLIQTLKFRISTMFNNSSKKAKHPTDNRPTKGIKDRLSGKEGRIRSNLMGKRVDFSARTVVGAEPTLKVNQLGVPEEISKILTKPEVVNAFNYEEMKSIVDSGKANFIIKNKNTKQEVKINLSYAFNNKDEVLINDIIIHDKNVEIKIENENVILPNEEDWNPSIFERVKTKIKFINSDDRVVRNNKLLDSKIFRKKINLELGDIVERHIRNGDVVILNRHPTLHKGGMLGMEIILMPHKSFRFNLAITPSFNADFDGDEMNIHVPQTYEAEAELRMIMDARYNIISPQESKPIIVIKQDALVASYLMTKKNFKLTREQFMNICLKGSRVDGSSLWNVKRFQHIIKIWKQYEKEFNIDVKNIYCGKCLLSLILPENFNYEKENQADANQPIVKIKQGVLLCGTFDKNILGSNHGSIIQLLNKEYGSVVASNFIDNIQFLGTGWLMVHSFSVGLQDCMMASSELTDEKNKNFRTIIQDSLSECYAKAEGIRNTTFNAGIREIRITAELSKARDIGMKIASNNMSKNNNFLTTVRSGAKGDEFNFSQIGGVIGQQNINNQRIGFCMSHNKRTLPHYPLELKDSIREYEAKGFVEHSFIHGLNPQEFFAHAKSGREGVISTSTKTADSGYIQRRITKLTENIFVSNDGCVKDTGEKIYQFVYGENGFDPTKVVKVNGVLQFCNLSRLVSRLNTDYEHKKLEYKKDFQPAICITEFERNEFNEKTKLIKFIKTNFPYTIVNYDWSISELQQRIESLKDEKERKDEKDAKDAKDERDRQEAENEEESEVSDTEDETEEENDEEKDEEGDSDKEEDRDENTYEIEEEETEIEEDTAGIEESYSESD